MTECVEMLTGIPFQGRILAVLNIMLYYLVYFLHLVKMKMINDEIVNDESHESIFI